MKKAVLDKYPKKQRVMKILEYALPAIHFILTFFLERKLFIFSGNFDFVNEIARNEYISDKTEMVIVYILSKLVAAIIIWLMWKFVFEVIKRRIDKQPVILFGIIFLIGVVMGAFYFPNMMPHAIDNYTNYSMAIRFLPTYWQSVYTGVAYAGSMMVFPHPFGIYLFQWMAFVSTVAYIYVGLDKVFQGKNVKYFSLFFFFIPESFYVVFDAYRNNYYAILCLFYFAYLIFTFRNKEKQFRMVEMISMSVLSAFIMVWRSEGILIGLVGMLLLVVAYRIKWKKILILTGVFLCTFLMTNSIQDIGSKKYYGQDYMIINTADVLNSILNNPDADLQYEGAEDDLLAIEMVVPVQVLKESGATGYRDYNWTSGRKNFNQSLASDQEAADYMSAYYHIIFHNIDSYLNVQTNCLYRALQIDGLCPYFAYSGEKTTFLEPFQYTRWQVGCEELEATYGTAQWKTNSIRKFGFAIVTWVVTLLRTLWESTGVNTILHAGMLIANGALLLIEAFKVLFCKEKKSLEYLLYFSILLGETAAIFLFMPVGRAAYFYPVIYVSYFVIFFYFAEKHNKKSIENKERV